MLNEAHIFKAPDITVNTRNYIIGSNFDAETIYIKEVKENTFAIDEKKELEEQLATLRKQIEDKKNELISHLRLRNWRRDLHIKLPCPRYGT